MVTKKKSEPDKEIGEKKALERKNYSAFSNCFT